VNIAIKALKYYGYNSQYKTLKSIMAIIHNIKESIDGPTPYGSHTPPMMHYPGFSRFLAEGT
jgi:hypothetical protein